MTISRCGVGADTCLALPGRKLLLWHNVRIVCAARPILVAATEALQPFRPFSARAQPEAPAQLELRR